MTGATCRATGCTAEVPFAGTRFCGFHWRLLPAELKAAWKQRDRAAPEATLVYRMTVAIERAQFGERLL